MAIPARPARGRKTVKRGPGKRIVEGRSFRLVDEVRYIQRRAAEHDGRIATIGQLILFSTKNRRCLAARPRRSVRGKAGSRGRERTYPDQGNRYHVRDRLEGSLSHRGTGFRLLG